MYPLITDHAENSNYLKNKERQQSITTDAKLCINNMERRGGGKEKIYIPSLVQRGILMHNIKHKG